MEKISIDYLENNDVNEKIICSFILKDTSNKCFSNKDADGNLIPICDLAKLYLDYTDMFGIKYMGKYIGLLSRTNENEVSIFIEPDYQGKGLGKMSLLLFEKLLKEEYGLSSLVAETTLDNTVSISLLKKAGYIETDETREVPINSVYVKIKKYSKEI